MLIPSRPGLTNALGCVVADVRHDYVNTINKRLVDLDPALVRATFEAQIAEGHATLERERVAVTSLEFRHHADMQFAGQSHLLGVDLPSIAISIEQLHEAFARAYWQRFEVELPELRPVLVNLHTALIGRRAGVSLAVLGRGEPRAALADALLERRRVWFEQGWLDTPVYGRDWLPAGATFDGPALIEQLDTTIVIEPRNHAERDPLGNLIIAIQ